MATSLITALVNAGMSTADAQDVISNLSLGVAIATSRTAVAADNGVTLELASGVTYTLSDAVPLPAGVTLLGPATGTATIAVTGTATINAATASIVMTAGQAYSAVPRPSNAAAFVVKGS
jgi:hypothetical protein